MQRQKERGQAYRAAADEDEDRGYDDWEKEKDQEEEEEEEEHTPSLQQCVQGSGEVVYLPAGWKNLTVNVGEAIGVGGQAPYDETERLRDALTALDQTDDRPQRRCARPGAPRHGPRRAAAARQGRGGTGGGANHHHGRPTSSRRRSRRPARWRGRWTTCAAPRLSPAHPEVAMLGAELSTVGTPAAHRRAARRSPRARRTTGTRSPPPPRRRQLQQRRQGGEKGRRRRKRKEKEKEKRRRRRKVAWDVGDAGEVKDSKAARG